MKKLQFFVLLLTAMSASAADAGKVNFFRGSLKDAQTQAAAEGKLYFVDFMASWCGPCRWMDESTFTDPELISYIEKSYIPVKVDIDDFEGYGYKEQYNIKLLPSILVFNSKGELLARYEQSFAPSKLLAALKSYDKPSNRTKLQQAESRPVTPVASTKTQQPSTSRPQPEASIPVAPTVEDIVKAGEGLYRFKVWKQQSIGYSLQIGAFSHMANVLKEVSALQEKFETMPVIIHITKPNEEYILKILVGEFKTREEAFAFQMNMNKKGVVGIIKDLSTMK